MDITPIKRYLKYFDSLKKDEVKLVLFYFITRILLLIIGYISYLSHLKPNATYHEINLGYLIPIIKSLHEGDIWWYLSIAENSYDNRSFYSESWHLFNQVNWGFFPLLPIILRLSSLFYSDLIVTGIIFSNLLTVLSIIFLYKLIAVDFDKYIAMLTTILLIIFPSSYFLSSAGTESMFLFLVITSVYFAKKKKWIAGGVLGSMAILTRWQGVFLFLPLVYIYYNQYKSFRVHDLKALSILFMPLALLSFMLYMYFLTGNFFATFDIQRIAWNHGLTYPFESIVGFIFRPRLIDMGGFDLSPLNFTFMIVGVVLTIAMLTNPKIPGEYKIYTFLSILIIISRTRLDGALRYLIVVFPLFLTLALLIHNRFLSTSITFVVFISLQTLYFIFLILGYKWAHV